MLHAKLSLARRGPSPHETPRVIRLIFKLVKSALLASKVAGKFPARHFGFVFCRPRHRIAGEPRLISGGGVADKLFHRHVPADRHDFVAAASGFRQPTTRRLAQPVRLAALRQSGGVAPVSKLLAECVAAVRLAGRGDQERQMLARRGVEHRLQVRMHRDRQRRAGLLLLHREHAVPDVLAAHADHIAAPLRGVEQQRQPKARLRCRSDDAPRIARSRPRSRRGIRRS